MKKSTILFLLIVFATFACHLSFCQVVTNADETIFYKVIANEVMVLEAPNCESNNIGTCVYGQIVSLVNSANPKDYSASTVEPCTHFEFYHISYVNSNEQTITGWIIKTFLVLNQTNIIRPKIVTNATIKGSSSNIVTLFSKNGDDYEIQTLSLIGETRVKIVGGYDSSSEYTEIQFDLQDETHILYVVTAFVRPDGVSALTITALSILLACLTIGLYSFLYTRKKKQRK